MTTAGKHWNYCVQSEDSDAQSFVWALASISWLLIHYQRIYKFLSYENMCQVYFRLCECICALLVVRDTEMKCVQDTFYPMMILDSLLFPTRHQSCIDNSHSPFNIRVQYAVDKITCEDPVLDWERRTCEWIKLDRSF